MNLPTGYRSCIYTKSGVQMVVKINVVWQNEMTCYNAVYILGLALSRIMWLWPISYNAVYNAVYILGLALSHILGRALSHKNIYLV